MARPVSDSQVRAVKPSSAIACYDPFIKASTLVVDALSARCTDIADSTLEQIEIYLSAHFSSTADTPIKRQKFENAEKEFAIGQLGTGVLSTTYGQMANMLSGGCLADMDKQDARVDFF